MSCLVSGPSVISGFSFWISGIPYDLIHGTSNFILCLILVRPLDNLAQKL